MMGNDTFASRLQCARERAGLSPGQLAALTGIGQTTVRRWELGKAGVIRFTVLARVARVLQVSPSWLLYGNDAEES